MPLSVNPHCRTLTLNESPSEKEGKCGHDSGLRLEVAAPQ